MRYLPTAIALLAGASVAVFPDRAPWQVMLLAALAILVIPAKPQPPAHPDEELRAEIEGLKKTLNVMRLR
jgi:hypothetical protein